MRKTSVWVLCGLMALTTAAFAAAQTGAMGTESGSMSGDMSKGDMAKPAAKTHHAAAKTHSASGDVAAIDQTAKTMTVKGEKKGEWNFTWDDKTVISPKGKTSADIVVGTDVKVWYKTSGDTKTATKIAIQIPKTSAKKSS